MSQPHHDADAKLDESLRRIRGALDYNRNHYAAMVEQIVAATGVEVAERVTARIADRHQRTMDRLARRRHRREPRPSRRADSDAASIPGGIVTAVIAVMCAVMAVANPQLWWLVFVALGLGTNAVKMFGRATRNRGAASETPAEERERIDVAQPTAAETRAPEPPVPVGPPVPAEPLDPRVARIQSLCDKLLAELESGPPIVREVVTEPKATIGGLRQACIEIARRERELRSVLAAQEEGALAADRDALAARVSTERDEIVRDRLGQALRALDEQIAHRAELATAASRLEAENTRILYTVENLHMQLLRARSTDMGAPELGGRLRDSLRDLGTQIDAVAEALEWASTPVGGGRGVTIETTPVPAPTATDAAQAERHAAAMRAAQAAQASRR
jgi:flagellin-like hook-associated protein FlgL